MATEVMTTQVAGNTKAATFKARAYLLTLN